MADLSIIAYRQQPGSNGDRLRRKDRRNNRGLMVDTRTGFSSRNRRDFIQRAISITASVNPMSVLMVRKRLRRDWMISDAISTPAPTQ